MVQSHPNEAKPESISSDKLYAANRKSLHQGPQPIQSVQTCLIGHPSAASLGLSQAGVRLDLWGALLTVQQS